MSMNTLCRSIEELGAEETIQARLPSWLQPSTAHLIRDTVEKSKRNAASVVKNRKYRLNF